MCVILHGLKKKHVRESEVRKAMSVNNAGFFLAALRGDRRESIRTLDEKEAIGFFNDKVKDDDEFVMHARIPSYGSLKLDNVHGWEEDGILFMHNMSLRNIDGFKDKFKDWDDKTDSEFFFRKMFIPYYRGLGKDAYKDGAMHPDLNRFVDWVCGTSNRFLFVMPDNRVLRFGQWVNEPDRKENGEIAFWASNSSYKVFNPAWPETGGTAQSAGKFPRCGRYPEYEGDFDETWESAYGCVGEKQLPAVTGGKKPELIDEWDRDGGKTLRDIAGDRLILQAALAEMVFRNLIATRETLSDQIPGEEFAAERLEKLLPKAYGDATIDALDDALSLFPSKEDTPPGYSVGDDVELLIMGYSTELQKGMAASVNSGRTPTWVAKKYIEDGLDLFSRQVSEFMRMANISLDWNGTSDDFAAAFYLTRSRKGNPIMEKVETIDLIGGPDVTYSDSVEQIDTVLDEIRKLPVSDDWGELPW